jgi:hypothetical protein
LAEYFLTTLAKTCCLEALFAATLARWSAETLCLPMVSVLLPMKEQHSEQ